MISIENREAFARAEAKAREVKPRVTIVPDAPFGTYSVSGSQGKEYTVTFQKQDGHWVASCTCPAHVADGRENYVPKPCYHLPAAYNAFHLHVRMRQEIKASIEGPAWPPAVAAQDTEDEQPPIECGCGKTGFAFFEGRWWCGECLKAEYEKREAQANAIEDEAELDAVREMEYTADMEARDRADLFG